MDELEILETLRTNKGFLKPEDWVVYGRAHRFTSVPAQHRPLCPDCGSDDFETVGQYVWFSNLIRLNDCRDCKLVFSDTLIDQDVVKRYFEGSYKDEKYFLRRRRRVFQQIAGLADDRTPWEGSVLDVGGATGHLLAILRSRRPDLRLLLNDLSEQACEHAKERVGLDTLCGGIEVLEQTGTRFDTVIMSDVLYYEPELRRIWALLPKMIKPGGTLVIRAPNKYGLIQLQQYLWSATHTDDDRRMQDRIDHFNPEHIYVFRAQYLLSRLMQLGFEASVLPSELLVPPGGDLKERLFYQASKVVAGLSCGKLITTPSFIICARNTG